MVTIVDGRTKFNGQPYLAHFQWLLRLKKDTAPKHLQPPLFVEDALPDLCVARLDFGRWVVDCPDLECHGSDYVWLDFPVFICSSCWNKTYQGQWLQVEVPTQEVIQTILAEMTRRDELVPLVPEGWYNWSPPSCYTSPVKTQTLEELHRETLMLEDGVR